MGTTRLTSPGPNGRPDGIVLASVDSHDTALALAGATPGAVSVVPHPTEGWIVVRRPGTR